MVNAHLDILELELRKLDGVRTVGFSSQHDVLYIQLFVNSKTGVAQLPFEATRIAQRHSSSPVAVELVRWSNTEVNTGSEQSLSPYFSGVSQEAPPAKEQEPSDARAGSIGSVPSFTPVPEPVHNVVEEEYDDINDIREEPSDYVDMSYPEIFAQEEDSAGVDSEAHSENFVTSHDQNPPLADDDSEEIDLELEQKKDGVALDRIALLTVTTSSENDEIEVHLSYDDLRTIGRAPTNRGLLGAIDATVQAIAELTGNDDFHAEWARSLEPGAEHASLVAVGLTNSEGTDTRHGIAGGSSPIDAAARATLNALNRVTALVNAENDA